MKRTWIATAVLYASKPINPRTPYGYCRASKNAALLALKKNTFELLNFRHEFHKNCIDPWLIEHRTCPMCKLDVLKFYGYVVGDQIYQTPSPQHTAPIASIEEVPVIVVAVPQGQQPLQPLQASNMSSFAPSHYFQSSRSPSSSVQQQLAPLAYQPHPQQAASERGRRNSAPATMPHAITASHQVTDV